MSYIYVYNFVCRFGDRYTLIDFADDIVLPALSDEQLRRGYGQTEYLIRGTQKATLGISHTWTCIVGRFIKYTVLVSTKKRDDSQPGGVANDDRSIETARTSVFVLLLENHQLLIAPETPDAPMDQAFRATANNFIQLKYRTFVQERATALGQPKAAIMRDIPRPDVRVTPISNAESIEQYIQRFARLTEVSVGVLDTNRQTQHDDFYEELHKRKITTGSQKADVTYFSEKGLDKTEITKELRNVARDANALVYFKGINHEGGTIHGDNEDIRVRLQMPDVGQSILDQAKGMVAEYESALATGTIVAVTLEKTTNGPIEAGRLVEA